MSRATVVETKSSNWPTKTIVCRTVVFLVLEPKQNIFEKQQKTIKKTHAGKILMSELIQIEKGYTQWRMKKGSGEFQAKKTDGGIWYHIILSDGSRLRHLAKVVEELAEEVKSEAPNL
jgi:hypothetical protein